jgi:uncharacterized protein (DUF433 family)
MNYKERISVNPNIMLGKPCIKGTRITVELILRKMAENTPVDDILNGYPKLKREDILAALAYSAEVISKEEILAS